MAEQEIAGLGKALTELKLEDDFLSNGELSNFHLAERGKIVNEIIAEKLKIGRWPTVISMIYGGFGKAEALYEGDKNQLKEEILKSAANHPCGVGRETLDSLVEAGESDLLFKLTGSIGFCYDVFMDVGHKLEKSHYFEDSAEDPKRMKKFNEIAAEKAMAEKKYHAVVRHSLETGDKEKIDLVFEEILSEEGVRSYSLREVAEEIALSDETKRDERLKRLVMSFKDSEKGLSPAEAFKLLKKQGVELDQKELAGLYTKTAANIDRWYIGTTPYKDDPRLSLLWAKKNVKLEPRTAYDIFLKQKYGGREAVDAAIRGLELEVYSHKETALGVDEIKEEHLKRAYKQAPFKVKAKIAKQLKDTEELKKLSIESDKKGQSEEAYRLWVAGGGDLTGDYIREIRANLIKGSIENHSGSMHFLDKSDTNGKFQAYDALMESFCLDTGKSGQMLRQAYEIALELGDESLIQRARVKMVSDSPRWALNTFVRQGKKDERGIDYVLSTVANEHGIDKGILEKIANKYQEA